MRKIRRFAALGAAVVIVATAIGGTATAQEVDVDEVTGPVSTFDAKAHADALTISLFGRTITSSAADAEVKPDFAKATVTETLIGEPINPATPATAEQPGGEAEATTESCNQDLAQVPGIARFDITCGIATARAGANDGAARALGAEIVIEPSVSQVLETLQIQDPATEATNELFDRINANLVEPLTGTPLEPAGDAVTTVQDVVGDVLGLQSTARVVIAPALAEASATECEVTAMARAQAVRVELLAVDVAGSETNGLLPEDLEAGEPLVTFTLADAPAKKIVSRCGGETVEEQTPKLACIQLGSTALGDALGIPTEEQCLEGGQTVCVLEETPLESCISLAAASADSGADAASIQIFKGVNGGVDLATGRAVVAAQAAPEPAPAAPAAAPAGELPRTGGPAVFPLIGGGLLAAAAVARRFAGFAGKA